MKLRGDTRLLLQSNVLKHTFLISESFALGNLKLKSIPSWNFCHETFSLSPKGWFCNGIETLDITAGMISGVGEFLIGFKLVKYEHF